MYFSSIFNNSIYKTLKFIVVEEMFSSEQNL